MRDAALGFVAATFIVAALVAVAGFTPWYGKAFSAVWGLKGATATKMIEVSHHDWIIAALRSAALFAILWFLPRLKRSALVALLFVFVAADLLPVVHQLNPRMPARFFLEPPPAARQFPQDRKAFRIFHEADWYGQEKLAQKYFSTGDAVYWIVRNGIFPMTPAGNDLSMVMERDYDKTALLPTIDFVDSVWDIKRSGRTDWWQPVMAMSNAWYRGTYRPFEAEKKRVKGQMKTAQPVEFTETEHSPRYYFADQIVTIRDRHDFVRKLSDGSYSRKVAFVGMPSFVPAGGSVKRLRETANTATIEVESQGRGFLVMSVTPHKYWRITIDGKESPAVVTNIGYQGVVVPGGTHTVQMRYRNPLAANGGKVSITAIVLLLAAALRSDRRRQSA